MNQVRVGKIMLIVLMLIGIWGIYLLNKQTHKIKKWKKHGKK